MTWNFQQCGMCDQQSLGSPCAYAQSDQSLCLSLEYSTTVKLLTEHHSEFLSFKGGCTGSSQSTHVKMPHCWKSHVAAHFQLKILTCATEATEFPTVNLRPDFVVSRAVEGSKSGTVCVLILTCIGCCYSNRW